MRRIFGWIATNKLLTLILILATFLRFVGARPGYPPYHSDEGISYSQGISIIREGTLDAHGYGLPYAYPTVVPLLNAIFFKLVFIPVAWIGFAVTNLGQIVDGFIRFPLPPAEEQRIFQLFILGEREINVLFWGRYVTAFFGTGVVLLTYLLAQRLLNRNVGLIAAFLVAVNYRQVLNSHIGLPDIYNAFFLLLSLIFSYQLLRKPFTKSYLLAGVFAGISFATKFQIFSFIPLLLAHLYIALEAKKSRLAKTLLSRDVFISIFSALLVFVLLNPFHFIHWEQTIDQLENVSLKYEVGKKVFDFYPISYLYHIGLGRLAGILAIIGSAFWFMKDWRKALWLLSPVVAAFFVLIYYTGGGFYTRNFVSVTPLILILSAAGVYFAFFYFIRIFNNKKLALLLAAVILFFTSSQNLENSRIVSASYSQPWNFKILSQWLAINITPNSKIAAHSSVPLPIENAQRLTYEVSSSFSEDEFRKEGAEYAVANLDWVTNEFYWWMSPSTDDFLKYWSKPVEIMEEMYPAMAIRELTSLAVYSVLNPWQAPESNFIVAKVPEYEVLKKEQAMQYLFEESADGWEKKGKLWYPNDNLEWREGSLVIRRGAAPSPILRWESEPIDVNRWPGFLIRVKMKTETQLTEVREGFIVASFYKSLEDTRGSKNRIAVRLSSRNDISGQWAEKELVGIVPKDAQFMTIRFQVYNPAQATVYLDEVDIYKADVGVDYGGVKVKPFYLDPDILFPFSHGGL